MCDKKATAKALDSEQMNYVSFDTQISIMNDALWDSLVYRDFLYLVIMCYLNRYVNFFLFIFKLKKK